MLYMVAQLTTGGCEGSVTVFISSAEKWLSFILPPHRQWTHESFDMQILHGEQHHGLSSWQIRPCSTTVRCPKAKQVWQLGLFATSVAGYILRVRW